VRTFLLLISLPLRRPHIVRKRLLYRGLPMRCLHYDRIDTIVDFRPHRTLRTMSEADRPFSEPPDRAEPRNWFAPRRDRPSSTLPGASDEAPSAMPNKKIRKLRVYFSAFCPLKSKTRLYNLPCPNAAV
jgi:hypothetical protein